MQRLILRLIETFGGLILFYGAMWLWGTKAAIAATLVYVLADGTSRLIRRKPIELMWWMVNGLALAFGVIDLAARTPFMIRYEGVMTNVVVGLFFIAGARGERPMLVDFAERSGRFTMPEARRDIVAYFRWLTLLWAFSFFFKAAILWWIVEQYPLGEALLLRTVMSYAVLGIMILISIKSHEVFGFCQRLGLFRLPEPPRAEDAVAAE